MDRSRDAEYTRLLDSCTRMLGKNTPTLAIKFRGMCIRIGNLLHDEDYRQFRAVLQEHGVLQSPDFILPGTRLFEES